MRSVGYSIDLIETLQREAEAAYPEEACGMISGVSEGGTLVPVGVHAMQNVYNRYHAADPEAYPRSNATAYLMDPRRQEALMGALQEAKTPVLAIYHSHVDVGAYFSEEDERAALWDGTPLLPGVEYLVVSVREQTMDAISAFRWHGGKFEGRALSLAQGERLDPRPGGYK